MQTKGVFQVALRLEDKKALVAEVNEVAGKAFSAVVAEYRGLAAGEIIHGPYAGEDAISQADARRARWNPAAHLRH